MNWFFSRSGSKFKSRSDKRDTESDYQTIRSIHDAIDSALMKAQSEQNGLSRRLDDVIAYAALVGGNDFDDFVTRSSVRTEMLMSSDANIKHGQARLAVLEKNISNFLSLKADLQSRFPGVRLEHDRNFQKNSSLRNL